MKKTDQMIRKLLVHGKEDWVMAAELVSIIISVAEIPYTENKKIKEIALDLIRTVINEELMVVGDVTKDGFQEWGISKEDALIKVGRRWSSLGRNPKLGDICWLSNTEKGDNFAKQLSD